MKENKKNVKLIDTLHRLDPSHLSHIIKHLNKNEIDMICECVYNVINTPLNLSSKKKCNLRRYLKKTLLHKKIENNFK